MPESEAFSLFEAWLIIWRSRWLALGISLLFVAIAAVYVLSVTPRYRAEVLLKPSDNRAPQGLSSQLGGLGGLATLAGLSPGGNSSAESLAVLTSNDFAAAFIKEQNLLPVFFADKWDAGQNRWKSQTSAEQIDVRDGVKFFDKRIRSAQEDKKTGFVRMSIEWTDPKVAADWANLLVLRINETMRDRALIEAEANVAYLKQELSAASVLVLQQSIGRLLENELQKLMFAKANKDYAFKVIDHAEPPKWKSFPQRALIIVSAFVFGAAIAVAFLLVRQLARKSRIA